MTRIKSSQRSRPPAHRRLLRGPRSILAGGLAAVGLLSAGAAIAGADGTVTLPGSPLIVSVGSLGECQSSYPNLSGANFYPPSDTLGNCGFFLSFPPAVGNPAALELAGKTGSVFGFNGNSFGPNIDSAVGGVLFTAINQGSPTGSGTAADPYSEITTFKASIEGKDYALITVTTTYVNGAADFTSSYDVQNVTGQSIPGLTTPTAAPLHFHASVAGDLYVANSDVGTGVFLGGPPRFIGGQNTTTGTLGGFIEASPAWSTYQEGGYFEPIFEAVRKSVAATPVFDNTVNPEAVDNGAGVSWDEFLTPGLAAGQHALFSIVNRSQVPTTLGVQPVNQTLTVGQTATIAVTATDNVGTPYAGRPLVYSIAGANPKSGSVTTNGSGVATISYVGTAPGLDTAQMFLDLAGTGSLAPQDPASAAQVTWLPAPPTPNSTYTVQSIKANSDGTLTIVFVPSQDGAATVEVTVPTGTISRNASIAKKKKCKKNQIRIKGKCRPKTTVSGKVTAAGKAGVPLKITVKPSIKVKKALAKGKKVQLTAKLTYKSALGGAPTVKTYHFTVKAKKKKKKHHH